MRESFQQTRSSQQIGACLAPLYAILDGGMWGDEQLPAVADAWAGAGVTCMQLRMKEADSTRISTVARQCLDRLRGRKVHFWINDEAQVARDVGATGVHLGQTDRHPDEARRILNQGQWVGYSTHTVEQAQRAEDMPSVDVVALGPIFPTPSKRDADPVVGLGILAEIRPRLNKPLVAIGGISYETCHAVLKAGADSVAVIGALGADDPLASAALAEQMVQRLGPPTSEATG